MNSFEILEFYLLVICVKEMKFGKIIVRIGLHLDFCLELPLPLACYGKVVQKSFCEVGVNDRMNKNGQVFMLVSNKVMHAFLDLVH